jgi:hypothetical protein
MRWLTRFFWITVALLLLATATAAAIPRFAFELRAPHLVERPRAMLDAPLRRAVDANLDKSPPTSVDEARDFALSVTDRMLHFGLEHPTSLAFTTEPREGNCIEYAQLFVRVFDRAAQKGKLKARAYVLHSERARLFGQKVPFHGFEDHDWALIDDHEGPGDARRFYVDPTMHDAGLGWDIASAVVGEIKLP